MFHDAKKFRYGPKLEIINIVCVYVKKETNKKKDKFLYVFMF